MKKRNIIIMTAILVLAIALTLAMTACAPKGNELEETEVPTETAEVTEATEATEPVTEPTEAATEAATEPVETAPEATQPVTTSKPSTGINNSGNNAFNNSQTSNTTTTVAPTPTEPVATEPPVVTPAVTSTEPAPTEHTHNWQEVYHEETSHDVWWVVCACGARFNNATEWQTHIESFPALDAFTYHGGYGSYCETVIDTPAYSTWVCACGATSDTQP